ncbi:hypothetical protein SAMN04487995_6008 [Dyadobacter koreensis]|uniref:Uncharacterized protein n=1 Tax=Dyadobacter koreensis TaxID=408657 RepID=A0A1H7B5P1_9BACT|nr:hypothetical protein [Dyadobacter koreensis]SEJ69772.1 hypothetical protein SAMN04487995_6008 [Dyadobacter koreensis]
MNNSPIDDFSPFVFDRYLLGTATVAEIEIVERWYRSLDGEKSFLDSLKKDEEQNLKAIVFDNIRKKIEFK